VAKSVGVKPDTRLLRRGPSRAIATTVLTAAMLLYATAAIAQESIAAARDLYAAAAYDEALARLNDLRLTKHSSDDDRAIEQYRALCLFALGRATDAERAIEAMVVAAPGYRPSEADASPRVQAAFVDVRRRVLPGIIQQKYNNAKAAFDRKDLASARAGFAQVIELLADPAVVSGPMQQERAALLTLATGFRDLSTPPVAPLPAAPAPQPAQPQRVIAIKPAPAAGRIYSAADPGIAAPTAVRQSVAALAGVFAPRPGAVEIVIDESGAVVDATIQISVNPVYDRLALATARSWRYRPAMFGGVPVKFRKVVALDPRNVQ
jgi:TonB family protein